MRPYATWKYVLLLVVTVLSALYSAPNLYGEDYSVQVSLESGEALPADLGTRIDAALKKDTLESLSSRDESGRWVVRFPAAESQLRANDLLKRELGNDYVVALNLAYLITGVVLVEVVFVYPGVGQLLVDAVSKRDFPVVQACCLIFAATFILLNLAADVGSILTNPRLRHPK